MLKIINDLKEFFEDNYKRIHVREYAKLQKISPPTASKILEKYKQQNILKKEVNMQYFYYYANKDSFDFRDLQRIYYRKKLINLINYIKQEAIAPKIILFGSLAKAEVKKTSDIDLAVITVSKVKIQTKNFEKDLNRKIQIFKFESFKKIPMELKNNILNGYNLCKDGLE